MTPLQKYRLKSLAKLMGLPLGQGRSCRSTMGQFCRHLKSCGFRPATVIDVGVADGTFDIYTAFPAAKFLLVEPLEEFEPALRAITARYDARYELVAAGAADETRLIHVGATMAEKHESALQSAPDDEIYEGWDTREVPVRRLDGLVERHGLDGPFLLKIDTQGTELDVIAGATGILDRVDVAILEVSFFNFAQKTGQPLIADVLAAMAEKNFYPYDIFGGYNRPLDGALAQMDIAFVPRDGKLRSDHRFAANKPSSSLHRRLISRCRGWIGA